MNTVKALNEWNSKKRRMGCVSATNWFCKRVDGFVPLRKTFVITSGKYIGEIGGMCFTTSPEKGGENIFKLQQKDGIAEYFPDETLDNIGFTRDTMDRISESSLFYTRRRTKPPSKEEVEAFEKKKEEEEDNDDLPF